MRALVLVYTLVTAVAPLAAQSLATADSLFAAGQVETALRMYEEAVAAQPANLGARVRAGYAALALRRPAVAEPHFRQVVQAAPASGAPLAKAGLALTLAQRGDQAGALTLLEQAVQAGYANPAVLDAEPAMAPLRTDPRYQTARAQVERNAFPCAADSAARAFDFWIGDWDVYATGTTQRVGANRIDRVSGGCAILENWTALDLPWTAPQTGKSLNFVDPATGLWRQVWMGSGRGQNNYEQGRFADGAMRFVFHRTTTQGVPITGRFTFFDLGPHRVRQLQESSTDGGATWQTVYDFMYVRRGSGVSPVAPY